MARTRAVTQIRGWLDAAGLKSVGTHQGGLGMFNPATGQLTAAGQTQVAQRRQTLGYTLIGTAGDPSGANTHSPPGSRRATTTTGWASCSGTTTASSPYLHPEQNNWQFIADPAIPVADRPHRIDFFVANTDPRYVFLEPDIYHMYNARGRFPNPDGTLWDPVYYMQKNWKRLVGWHVKDAVRAADPRRRLPATRSTQTKIRPGFPINGGDDVIYSTEGHLGNGAAVGGAAGLRARRSTASTPAPRRRPRARAWTRACGASGASSRRSWPTARRASSTTSWSPTQVPAPPPTPVARCGTRRSAPSSCSG